MRLNTPSALPFVPAATKRTGAIGATCCLILAVSFAAGCRPGPTPSERDTANAPGEFEFDPETLSGSAVVESLTGLNGASQRDGLIALFDGESLFGWQTEKTSGNWRVENGAIVCNEGKAELLETAVPFADFELSLEFKIESGGNSGVFVRSAEQISSVEVDTYEVNIAASHPEGYTTGAVVGRLKATGVNGGDDGQWHAMRVICDGPRIRTFIDGDDAVDLLQTEDSPGLRKNGYIGLQHRIGAVGFRNITLKPLNLQPQFEGGLDGWRVQQAKLKDGSMGQAVFESVNDSVHVKSGLGFLESNADYGNFLVQFTATTNALDVNSGLFFRTEPATPEAPSNGYELQIHNGFDGDRSKPSNGGTGGIFRRSEARFIASDDLAPAVITFVAYQDRFASWVNGYPVLDWTDDRDPDPNPRRGKRLTAGRLSLQAHDPTTDVTISDFRVMELPSSE